MPFNTLNVVERCWTKIEICYILFNTSVQHCSTFVSNKCCRVLNRFSSALLQWHRNCPDRPCLSNSRQLFRICSENENFFTAMILTYLNVLVTSWRCFGENGKEIHQKRTCRVCNTMFLLIKTILFFGVIALVTALKLPNAAPVPLSLVHKHKRKEHANAQ